MAVTLIFKRTGQYSTEVKGESHYQEHLSYLASMSDDGVVEPVDLFLEDYNPQDSNAVVVTAEGQDVGYLSREDAVKYREQLKRLGYPLVVSTIGSCAGKLIGGHVLNSGLQASWGIVLDLALDALETEDIVRSKDA